MPTPFGHRTHSIGLIRYLVDRPEAFAYSAARDLTRYEEHRRGAGVCIGQAGCGVIHPTPGTTIATPGFPDVQA